MLANSRADDAGRRQFPIPISDLSNASRYRPDSEPQAKVVAWIDRRAHELGGKPGIGGKDHHMAHHRPRTD